MSAPEPFADRLAALVEERRGRICLGLCVTRLREERATALVAYSRSIASDSDPVAATDAPRAAVWEVS